MKMKKLTLAQLCKEHRIYEQGIRRLEQSILHDHSKESINWTLLALKKYYVWDNETKRQIMSLVKHPTKRWARSILLYLLKSNNS